MKIINKHFILRPIQLSDSQEYWECMQDIETKKGFNCVPESLKEAKEEIKDYIAKNKKGLTDVFTVSIDGKYAGNVRLDKQDWDKDSDKGRIHLWMHPNFRKKGIATSALKELIRYGFEKKGFCIIYAQCKKSNKAVARVLEKAGFQFVEERFVDNTQKLWWEIYK